MLTFQALTCFEENNHRNGGSICSCPTSPWHPLKRARPNSKLDCIFQLNCRGVRTNASCETTSNIGELRPLRSIQNASPFRWTMADYICNSSHFVVSLQSESYIHIINSREHKVKTYGTKEKEALTRDWEELNKELYVCNLYLQNNFKVYFCRQM